MSVLFGVVTEVIFSVVGIFVFFFLAHLLLGLLVVLLLLSFLGKSFGIFLVLEFLPFGFSVLLYFSLLCILFSLDSCLFFILFGFLSNDNLDVFILFALRPLSSWQRRNFLALALFLL